jgi:hypothetical protein
MENTQPCRFFQLGICRMGSECTYAHTGGQSWRQEPPSRQQPAFQRPPSHQFANSHAENGIAPTRASSDARLDSGAHAPLPNAEKLFKEWRYSIPTGVGRVRPLGQGMSSFFQQALELVSGEVGPMQETITLLASEGGHKRIAELVGQDFSHLNQIQMRRIFDKQLLPFFKTITSKEVTQSVILGPRLMTIYNVLYNSDGDQAVDLFTAVGKHLQSLPLSREDQADLPNIEAVEAIGNSLAVLDKLVEVNTGAQVHEGLKHVAEIMALLFEDVTGKAIDFALKPARSISRGSSNVWVSVPAFRPSNLPSALGTVRSSSSLGTAQVICQRRDQGTTTIR